MPRSRNSNLTAAKKAANDEFYTQISDIENELRHYKDFFKDKVVYLNCDDPEESNFWKFFELKFQDYGLKKLISTHFDSEKPTYSLELSADINSDGKIDKWDIVKRPLKTNGDFRSPESIELLKQADVVVTNPPFSLFREYIAQLMEYKKYFLIIGNKNAVNYLLPLIKDNKLWLGYSSPDEFKIPDGSITKQVNGLCRWFTNIPNKKRSEKLILAKKYNANDYPKYDNYDAIEVGRVADIPEDYDGVMGVPITFLGYYCPDQFEIIGITYSKDKNPDIEKLRTDLKRRHTPFVNGQEKYPRVLIKRK